jgi:hypothetical protein
LPLIGCGLHLKPAKRDEREQLAGVASRISFAERLKISAEKLFRASTEIELQLRFFTRLRRVKNDKLLLRTA